MQNERLAGENLLWLWKVRSTGSRFNRRSPCRPVGDSFPVFGRKNPFGFLRIQTRRRRFNIHVTECGSHADSTPWGQETQPTSNSWGQNIHPDFSSHRAGKLRHNQFFRFGRLISYQKAGMLDCTSHFRTSALSEPEIRVEFQSLRARVTGTRRCSMQKKYGNCQFQIGLLLCQGFY